MAQMDGFVNGSTVATKSNMAALYNENYHLAGYFVVPKIFSTNSHIQYNPVLIYMQ